MVVFTAKITRRKIVMVVLSLFVIVFSAVSVIMNSGEETVVSVSDETQPTIVERKVKSNEERVSLLRECGWEVDGEPIEFIEVKIPEKFDGVYTEYNELQKKQGMDLSKFSGKRVMRYTYKVNDYPGGEDGVVVNLIVYKDKLIGGDVSSPKLGGFMHGLLEKNEKTAE